MALKNFFGLLMAEKFTLTAILIAKNVKSLILASLLTLEVRHPNCCRKCPAQSPPWEAQPSRWLWRGRALLGAVWWLSCAASAAELQVQDSVILKWLLLELIGLQCPHQRTKPGSLGHLQPRFELECWNSALSPGELASPPPDSRLWTRAPRHYFLYWPQLLFYPQLLQVLMMIILAQSYDPSDFYFEINNER